MNLSATLLVVTMAAAVLGVARAEPLATEEPLHKHIPDSLLRGEADGRYQRLRLPVLIEPAGGSAVDRWEKFNAEFGIRKYSSGWAKGSLQKVKYQLDEALFTIKDFVEHDLAFDYAIGSSGNAPRSRRIRDNRWRDAWENARLRSDISFSPETKAFVGIQLVLPISD